MALDFGEDDEHHSWVRRYNPEKHPVSPDQIIETLKDLNGAVDLSVTHERGKPWDPLYDSLIDDPGSLADENIFVRAKSKHGEDNYAAIVPVGGDQYAVVRIWMSDDYRFRRPIPHFSYAITDLSQLKDLLHKHQFTRQVFDQFHRIQQELLSGKRVDLGGKTGSQELADQLFDAIHPQP